MAAGSRREGGREGDGEAAAAPRDRSRSGPPRRRRRRRRRLRTTCDTEFLVATAAAAVLKEGIRKLRKTEVGRGYTQSIAIHRTTERTKEGSLAHSSLAENGHSRISCLCLCVWQGGRGRARAPGWVKGDSLTLSTRPPTTLTAVAHFPMPVNGTFTVGQLPDSSA